MEAMASGALIFVDRMFVPRPHPLIDGRHVVYYDNNNKTELFEKLDRYRSDPGLMTTVAASGYLHSMRHHRAACLIDYILRTAHTLQLEPTVLMSPETSQPNNAPGKAFYKSTGFHMRLIALSAALTIKKLSKKGRQQSGHARR